MKTEEAEKKLEGHSKKTSNIGFLDYLFFVIFLSSLAVMFFKPDLIGKVITIADNKFFGEETAANKNAEISMLPNSSSEVEAATIKKIISKALESTPVFEKEQPRKEIIERGGTEPFVERAKSYSKEDIVKEIEKNGGIEIEMFGTGDGGNENIQEKEAPVLIKIDR